ncbi:YicC/YloC family endoribonuclease [Peptoniphilus mikwangii]|uniref:YicC/YloC family endoribonuclease n=1 Tax=Peptoniphilus mikwangii TaxID=1354300 RepID=UPI00041F6911|nr:YicC/YloC family endoribonuclease [Peptoniphilus mikwangii]
MNSMTGYGSGIASNERFSIKVEMKSVNNRYCDISVRLPKILFALEERVKKSIKDSVNRGKIDVFINLEYINSTDVKIEVDTTLAKQYYLALTELKNELNISDDISLRDIYYMQGVLVNKNNEEDINEYSKILDEALNEALTNFISMRNIEGEETKKFFIERISDIEKISAMIKERAPITLKENTEKLRETIESNVDIKNLDLPRLSTELAIMCDRLSIDEEITRVFLHLKQFNKIINLDGAIGRKLDFLVQELNREVNTIGSKSTDIDTLNCVVELKSEIEKIREQIQNIE